MRRDCPECGGRLVAESVTREAFTKKCDTCGWGCTQRKRVAGAHAAKPSASVLCGLRAVVSLAEADVQAAEKGDWPIAGSSKADACKALEWLSQLLKEA